MTGPGNDCGLTRSDTVELSTKALNDSNLVSVLHDETESFRRRDLPNLHGVVGKKNAGRHIMGNVAKQLTNGHDGEMHVLTAWRRSADRYISVVVLRRDVERWIADDLCVHFVDTTWLWVTPVASVPVASLVHET